MENFDYILDKCLDRIAAGDDVNVILSDYPDEADRLRPLLQSAVQTSRWGSFTINTEVKYAARQRFDAALARHNQPPLRQPWYRRYLLRPAVLAAATAVIITALVVFGSVQTALSPGDEYQVSDITPVASTDGNFAFLISDELNAISHFDNVTVTITKIGIQQSDGKWIEIEPTDKTVDLTTVPGDAVKVIWQGNIPAGDYQKVFIYIDDVTGYLKGLAEATEIKLPSQKLHIAIPFSTSETTVTSFTFDLTVFATGSGQNLKYILKPQASESGVAKESVPPAATKKNPDNPPAINGNDYSNSDKTGEEEKTKEEKTKEDKDKEDKDKEEKTQEEKDKEPKIKETKTTEPKTKETRTKETKTKKPKDNNGNKNEED